MTRFIDKLHITIENEHVFVNNLYFCRAGAGNGRANLPTGFYEVESQYAHCMGKVLPKVVGLGWIGADEKCDIVLGAVRTRDGILGDANCLSGLLHRIEEAESDGTLCTLEVM